MPKNYANTSRIWFKENTDLLWTSGRYVNIVKWLPVIYGVVILGYCVYNWSFKMYDIPEFDLIVDNIQAYITMLKRKVRARKYEKIKKPNKEDDIGIKMVDGNEDPKSKAFECEKECPNPKCSDMLSLKHDYKNNQNCGFCQAPTLSYQSKSLELEKDIKKWKIEHVTHFSKYKKLSEQSIKILEDN